MDDTNITELTDKNRNERNVIILKHENLIVFYLTYRIQNSTFFCYFKNSISFFCIIYIMLEKYIEIYFNSIFYYTFRIPDLVILLYNR